MAAASESAIAELIAPVVESTGADLEEVQLRPAGRRSVLVVVVDADGGVTLEAVADLSRRIGEVLDESPVMGDSPYTLEVTSPGVDRPLTLPRHWRRNADRLVRVVLADGTTVEGRIVGPDDTSVTVATKDGEQQLAFDDVRRATVQVEFGAKKES